MLSQRGPDQRYWVKDDYVLNCTSCVTRFTVTLRRHHCRSCGEVFCNACTSKSIPLPHLNYPATQNQRVCELCFTKSTIINRDPESYSKEKMLQRETLEDLIKIYKASVKPLEVQFKFGSFYSPLLTDADFDSKPMVSSLTSFQLPFMFDLYCYKGAVDWPIFCWENVLHSILGGEGLSRTKDRTRTNDRSVIKACFISDDFVMGFMLLL